MYDKALPILLKSFGPEPPRVATCYNNIGQVFCNQGRNADALDKTGIPGPEGSTLKVFWSELDQRVKNAALEILGPVAMVPEGDPGAMDEGYWAYELLWSRAATIYAGTSEVQRNIISTRVLGLPR